jgi:hypothetical protein
MDIWRGPITMFVLCLVLMYLFTGNGFLTSLKIAGLSAGTGVVSELFFWWQTPEGQKKINFETMNKVTALLLATLLVGFVAFSMCYWMFAFKWQDAVVAGGAGAFGGLVTELWKSRKTARAKATS